MPEKDSLDDDGAPEPRTLTGRPPLADGSVEAPQDAPAPASAPDPQHETPAPADLGVKPEPIDALVARIAASLAAHAQSAAAAQSAECCELEPEKAAVEQIAGPVPPAPPREQAPGARLPDSEAAGQAHEEPAMAAMAAMAALEFAEPAATGEAVATAVMPPEDFAGAGAAEDLRESDGYAALPASQPAPAIAVPFERAPPLQQAEITNGTEETASPRLELQREPVASRAEPAVNPRDWRSLARTGLRYGAYVFGGYLALVVALIPIYLLVNPPASTLMLWQRLTGREVRQNWVPIAAISPNLVKAVIASEDGRFCDHWGVDPVAIREAIARAKGGLPRGASTISMQVAKNIFLWPSKSYLRKAIEVPVTLLMDLVWPKRRVLEVYLNVAEWGPGVFGAEAAARHHFKKSAAKLTEREAALLAAALPNPVRRDAGDPGPATTRKASVVQARVRQESGQAWRCVLPP